MPTSQNPDMWVSLGLKILAGFVSFVGGVFAAGVVLKGHIDEIKTHTADIKDIKRKQETCPVYSISDDIMSKIAPELNRIHDRIDDLYKREAS